VPLFLIERQHAEQMELDELGAQSLAKEDLDGGLRWVYSFLSADRRKTYCLFQAPSAEVVRAASRRAGLPDAVLVEIEPVGPDRPPPRTADAGRRSGPGD
jgi:hypothetical protein